MRTAASGSSGADRRVGAADAIGRRTRHAPTRSAARDARRSRIDVDSLDARSRMRSISALQPRASDSASDDACARRFASRARSTSTSRVRSSFMRRRSRRRSIRGGRKWMTTTRHRRRHSRRAAFPRSNHCSGRVSTQRWPIRRGASSTGCGRSSTRMRSLRARARADRRADHRARRDSSSRAFRRSASPASMRRSRTTRCARRASALDGAA